jgi:hypothetical protein
VAALGLAAPRVGEGMATTRCCNHPGEQQAAWPLRWWLPAARWVQATVRTSEQQGRGSRGLLLLLATALGQGGERAAALERGEGSRGFCPKLFLFNSQSYISIYIYREDLT